MSYLCINCSLIVIIIMSIWLQWTFQLTFFVVLIMSALFIRVVVIVVFLVHWFHDHYFLWRARSEGVSKRFAISFLLWIRWPCSPTPDSGLISSQLCGGMPCFLVSIMQLFQVAQLESTSLVSRESQCTSSRLAISIKLVPEYTSIVCMVEVGSDMEGWDTTKIMKPLILK